MELNLRNTNKNKNISETISEENINWLKKCPIVSFLKKILVNLEKLRRNCFYTKKNIPTDYATASLLYVKKRYF